MCEIWITDFQKALTHKLGGRLRAKKKKIKSNKHEANSLPVDIKVAHICKFFFFQSFSGVYHFNLLIDHKRSPEKEKKRSFGCSCSSSSPPLRHVLSSLLTLMVSKWVSHPTLPLSLSSCHNHCSLWSVCPLCPFKMRRVMRALENYVSGLFSYSGKISSHIPRSLSLDSLPIPFSWVQWLFVLLTRSHCGWSRSSSAFNIHDGPFSVCSPHGNWMIKMGDLNIQFDTTVKLFCIA